MKYENPEAISVANAEAIIIRNNPEELLSIPLAASLYSDDFEWAQSLCIRLASHPHFNVRGNALLGFGHLARRFGRLDRNKVDPLLQQGLQDSDGFGRGQADSAADDIALFLEPKAFQASA